MPLEPVLDLLQKVGYSRLSDENATLVEDMQWEPGLVEQIVENLYFYATEQNSIVYMDNINPEVKPRLERTLRAVVASVGKEFLSRASFEIS